MVSAETTQFRSALHGFNRFDVVNFIESMTGEHEKALHALQKENAAITEQTEKLLEENAALAARIGELNTRCEALNAQLEDAAQVEPVISELPVEAPEAPAENETDAPSAEDLELAAYRRAEAVERTAVQRANTLYQQMTEVCTGLNGRMVATDDEISLLYTELSATLDRMREALADVKLIFDEAPEQILALGGACCDE